MPDRKVVFLLICSVGIRQNNFCTIFGEVFRCYSFKGCSAVPADLDPDFLNQNVFFRNNYVSVTLDLGNYIRLQEVFQFFRRAASCLLLYFLSRFRHFTLIFRQRSHFFSRSTVLNLRGGKPHRQHGILVILAQIETYMRRLIV